MKYISVEVTVKGPVHPDTGMVMNVHDLKVIIDKVAMNPMDHKHLDKDVAIFRYFIFLKIIIKL